MKTGAETMNLCLSLLNEEEESLEGELIIPEITMSRDELVYFSDQPWAINAIMAGKASSLFNYNNEDPNIIFIDVKYDNDWGDKPVYTGKGVYLTADKLLNLSVTQIRDILDQ